MPGSVGKRVPRNEDARLLTGRALFVDDVQAQRHRALAEPEPVAVGARGVGTALADVVAVQALVLRAAVLVDVGDEVLPVLQGEGDLVDVVLVEGAQVLAATHGGRPRAGRRGVD